MRMKRFAALALAAVLGCASRAQTAPEPVNPNATPEARALLAYLDSISGKATIAGQHNYPNVGARWTDMAYDLTAKYPGLFGGDFGFSGGEDKDSVLSRPAMIEEVKRQYRNGAVVTLTWHEVRPTDDEPVTFHDSVQGHLTDAEWQQLLTPGSPLYQPLVRAGGCGRRLPEATARRACAGALPALSRDQRQLVLVGGATGQGWIGGALSPDLRPLRQRASSGQSAVGVECERATAAMPRR